MNTDRDQATCRSQPTYEAPGIVYRGTLKQFAGSPLGGGGENQPDNVLGLPG